MNKPELSKSEQTRPRHGQLRFHKARSAARVSQPQRVRRLSFSAHARLDRMYPLGISEGDVRRIVATSRHQPSNIGKNRVLCYGYSGDRRRLRVVLDEARYEVVTVGYLDTIAVSLGVLNYAHAS